MIRHLIFDLDRTLWDFEKASKETFREIHEKFIPPQENVPFDDFFDIYRKNNEYLWEQYRNHLIAKEILRTKRFENTLEFFSLQFKVSATAIADYYIDTISTKAYLFSGTKETLEELKKRYTLSIMTNGFKEVQYPKLERSGIRDLFSFVFISEEIGYNKPHQQIFSHALKELGCKPEEATMIGDDFEVDIMGAINAGMPAIWFKPEVLPNGEEEVHHSVKIIHSIPQLLKIL